MAVGGMFMTKFSIQVFLTLALCISHFEAFAQDECLFHSIGRETTPLGKTLDYRQVSDSTYQLFYGVGNDLKKLDWIMSCNTAPITRATFVTENEDYIFLSRGCGSACRIGMLVPLKGNGSFKAFNYWMEVDLEQGLIATVGIDHEVFINVYDLKTDKTTRIAGVKCDFGISVLCVKNVTIKNRQVTVSWADELGQPPTTHTF